jgi:hypothetical protein
VVVEVTCVFSGLWLGLEVCGRFIGVCVCERERERVCLRGRCC